MSTMIQKECDRLQLNDTWRRTIDLYLTRFESDLLAEEEFCGVDFSEEELHQLVIEEQTSMTILDTLRQIDSDINDMIMKVLFSQSIARLPVFFLRARRDAAGGPQFWDPLEETLQDFLSRAKLAGDNVRRYTSLTSIHGDDVIAARVFTALSSNDNAQ